MPLLDLPPPSQCSAAEPVALAWPAPWALLPGGFRPVVFGEGPEGSSPASQPASQAAPKEYGYRQAVEALAAAIQANRINFQEAGSVLDNLSRDAKLRLYKTPDYFLDRIQAFAASHPEAADQQMAQNLRKRLSGLDERSDELFRNATEQLARAVSAQHMDSKAALDLLCSLRENELARVIKANGYYLGELGKARQEGKIDWIDYNRLVLLLTEGLDTKQVASALDRAFPNVAEISDPLNGTARLLAVWEYDQTHSLPLAIRVAQAQNQGLVSKEICAAFLKTLYGVKLLGAAGAWEEAIKAINSKDGQNGAIERALMLEEAALRDPPWRDAGESQALRMMLQAMQAERVSGGISKVVATSRPSRDVPDVVRDLEHAVKTYAESAGANPAQIERLKPLLSALSAASN
jgi:hypothetical protein